MRKIARLKRDIELFLYKTGWESGQPHTLFQCALHFDLSVNQIYLNIKKLKIKIKIKASTDGIQSAAQEYGISVSSVERLLVERLLNE